MVRYIIILGSLLVVASCNDLKLDVGSCLVLDSPSFKEMVCKVDSTLPSYYGLKCHRPGDENYKFLYISAYEVDEEGIQVSCQ